MALRALSELKYAGFAVTMCGSGLVAALALLWVLATGEGFALSRYN